MMEKIGYNGKQNNKRRFSVRLLPPLLPSLVLHNKHQPRNAVGEMMPVLLATMIEVPVSINGIEKSTTDSRSELIIKAVRTISVFRFTKSAIRPFHFPCCNIRTYNPKLVATLVLEIRIHKHLECVVY